MDDYKKCMLIDKTIIICGVLGLLTGIIAIILGLQGTIRVDTMYLVMIPLSCFFIYYGIKLLIKDKERYGDKK